MTPDTTRLPSSRPQRRPLSQSSQLMTLVMGIEGALGFEFIRHFAHKRLTLRQDTVFRPTRKPPDFFPINLQGAAEGDCGQLLRALARGRLRLGIHRHQHTLHEQLLRLDDLNDTVSTLEL